MALDNQIIIGLIITLILIVIWYVYAMSKKEGGKFNNYTHKYLTPKSINSLSQNPNLCKNIENQPIGNAKTIACMRHQYLTSKAPAHELRKHKSFDLMHKDFDGGSYKGKQMQIFLSEMKQMEGDVQMTSAKAPHILEEVPVLKSKSLTSVSEKRVAADSIAASAIQAPLSKPTPFLKSKSVNLPPKGPTSIDLIRVQSLYDRDFNNVKGMIHYKNDDIIIITNNKVIKYNLKQKTKSLLAMNIRKLRPNDISIDSNKNIYITDAKSFAVYTIPYNSFQAAQIFDGKKSNPAIRPFGITTDKNNNIIFSDNKSKQLFLLDNKEVTLITQNLNIDVNSPLITYYDGNIGPYIGFTNDQAFMYSLLVKFNQVGRLAEIQEAPARRRITADVIAEGIGNAYWYSSIDTGKLYINKSTGNKQVLLKYVKPNQLSTLLILDDATIIYSLRNRRNLYIQRNQ